MQVDCSIAGVDWSAVRCNFIAAAINSYCVAGRPYNRCKPALSDDRFFPAQYDERQSKIEDKDSKLLLLWAAQVWPAWSAGVISLLPIFQWLGALNTQDQKKTLNILRTHYGLGN
jgi:hypothetical protein